MDDIVKSELGKLEMSQFHTTLLADCKKLVKVSRDSMSQHYDSWDANDDVYNSKRTPDKEDIKAKDRKEPVKMVVPMSYSQVQTFIAFCFSLYNQRDAFFELVPTNVDSFKPAKVGEAFLTRDLIASNWDGKLYQFLLDISKFGLGVVKTAWTHEMAMQTVTQQVPRFNVFGLDLGMKEMTTVQNTTKFLGNRILNISPYRFFPDVRLPLCRFQEGEFCASEDEYSYITLKRMEKDGTVAGITHLKGMSKKDFQDRGVSKPSDNFRQAEKEGAQSEGTYILTEVQRRIIPSEYMIGDKPMGTEDYPVLYNVWYVNDSRIVKCEPMGLDHDMFTFDVGEFNPDQHHKLNMALSDTIDMLQSTISWFINARITSVRKVIGNKLIVNPEAVEMKDIEERNPVIRVKPAIAASRGGMDAIIKQLDITDVTTNHLQDVRELRELVQMVTGINDNLLGQFNRGRRSATEARNVNSSAASRLQMIAKLIFSSAIEPMGRKMLSNLRQGLDEPSVVRLVGIQPGMEGAGFVTGDKSDLQGNYDFEVFDGTLPSEKGLIAQTLENILMGVMKSPEVAIALQIDPQAILKDVMELRGVRNPQRFFLQSPVVPPALGGQQPGQQQNVVNMPQQGGLQPSNAPQPNPDATTGGFAKLLQ